MADTLKNLQYMTINKGMKRIIGGDKMSHFPDMRIQDDSTLYAKLLAKQRSTFDRSNLYIGGTRLTNLENGLVQGWVFTPEEITGTPADNYISTKFSKDISTCKEFEIYSPLCTLVKIPSDGLERYFMHGRATSELSYGNNAQDYVRFTMTNARIYVKLRLTDFLEASRNQIVLDAATIGQDVKLGDTFQLKLKRDNTGYRLYIKVNNGEWLTRDLAYTNKILDLQGQVLGTAFPASSNFTYTVQDHLLMDYKYMRVTAYGEEIFTCNNTGVDLIKKEATFSTQATYPNSSYSNVGGIFTQLNYDSSSTQSAIRLLYSSLQRNKLFNFRYEQDIIIDYYAKSVKGNVTLLSPDDAAGLGLSVQHDTDADFCTYKFDLRGQPDTEHQYGVTIFTQSIQGPILEKGTYRLIISFENAQVNCGLIRKRDNLIIAKVSGVASVTEFEPYYGYITRPRTVYYNGLGFIVRQIDLNSIKFYIEGELVFQPVLYIPYTQSKTNEKIVDATYRDRVQDMYEQFGYTYYYTIGDVPEKYNVVAQGNPTLIGGVASNFGNLQYLMISQSKIKYSISNKLVFESPIYYYNVVEPASDRYVMQSYNQIPNHIGDFSIAIWQNGAMSHAYIYYREELNKDLAYISEEVGLTLGDTIQWKIIVTPQGVDFYYRKNGGEWIFRQHFSFSFTNYYQPLLLGGHTVANHYITNPISISDYLIEIDDKEVFRGYEPAITDAFTLATNKGTDIIETYSDNAGTYYELRADLVQRCIGQIPATSTEVTYPRPFRDADNIVQVSYFDVGESTATPTIAHIAPKLQTKDGFTIGATTNLKRNYYAEGKAVLG